MDASPAERSASEHIDALIADHPDWRGEALRHARALIHEVDETILETWKWRGAPVWEHEGIIVVGNIFKQKVKLGFMYGALLDDPKQIFNGELGGNQRRSVELAEGDALDDAAFRDLVRAAITYNVERATASRSARS
ncbi:DUF1801 domain-containing protein [Humidisolicoccus flavus]|uniref:DUF1801 domain-containing protein n=1 Tax=Humidisolicoccus flavus TaxID=3111414 RepID=UPI00324C05E4